MPRNIGADGRTVYRARITTTDAATGNPYTWHEGPYSKPGAALARVTFWANYHREDDGTTPTSGVVEQAHTVWTPVGQAPDAAVYAPAVAAGIREAASYIDNDDDCGCGGCDSCQPRAYAAELRRRADDIDPTTTEETAQ